MMFSTNVILKLMNCQMFSTTVDVQNVIVIRKRFLKFFGSFVSLIGQALGDEKTCINLRAGIRKFLGYSKWNQDLKRLGRCLPGFSV